MRILFIGDIVSTPGLRAVKSVVPALKRNHNIDVVICNAENSCYGIGLSGRIAEDLFSNGIDVITLGNHSFSNRDFQHSINNYISIVRPSNIEGWPGKDYCVIDRDGFRLGIINLLGQVDITPIGDNPFFKADSLVKRLKEEEHVNGIFLDFHAEATSEKQAIGFYLDGRVSAVCGTHTHVQTADDRILPNGTAYITDVGMCGVSDSIIGMDIDTSLRRFIKRFPAKFEPAEGEAFVNAVIIDLNDYGLCSGIRRVFEYE